ncbi:retrograde transporter [Ephemerocybe angulata]|uniref:Retrograde transporter n=1 Tax=Ephemerocybe angulata TaxID=980116 RepID=A0A8H6MFF7_9AGAR|nr:retrograde transporter [Tulosesus angulatus]
MSDVTSNPSRPPSPSASLLAANDLPTARPYRFVWDPSSRRPGPESVAGTTEGGRYATDYIVGHAQHPLGVLNNPSSMNLALGSLPAEWSSARLGFHAISTVLNNPHKKQAPPKAHSSLPAVPPADLPRVRRKDFDSYLKAIRPEWDKYERNTQLGKEGQAQVEALRFTRISEGDEEAEDDDNSLAIPRQRSNSTATVPSSPLPIQARTIPPLDTVPSVFFEPGFNLGDAKTFGAVTEQASLNLTSTPTQSNMRMGLRDADEEDPTDPLALSHTLPLLEKFDHYADTVEQHLIREISLRSTSFFAALTNLRDLQTSSTACLSRIQNLRQKLSEVDEGTAKKGLELVKVKREETRVQEVRDGVKMVEGVVEMMGVLKGLVHAGQWGEALGVVEVVEGMWEAQQEEEQTGTVRNGDIPRSGSGYPRLESMAEEEEEADVETNGLTPSKMNKKSWPRRVIPLSSLTAFSAVPSHLRSITMEIAASLSADLVAVLKEDWTSYVEAKEAAALEDAKTPPKESRSNPGSPNEGDDIGESTLKRVNGTISETRGNEGRDGSRDQGLKDRLKPLLMNLTRTHGLKEGILSWREVILAEVKSVVSRKYPGVDTETDNGDGDTNEARAELAKRLREQSQETFMVSMKDVYRALMNGIERLRAQGDIISELLEQLKPELQKGSQSKSMVPPRLSSGTGASNSPSASSQSRFPSITEDLSDFFYAACELANASAAKVVTYRSEQHSALELGEFVDFFNTSWAFVVRCEVLSRRMIIGLRSTVVSQAKQWLQVFHQARLTRSARLVEDEVWNAVAVSSHFQGIANIIVGSVVQDSPLLIVKPGDGRESRAIGVSNPSQETGLASAQPPPTAAVSTPTRPSAGSSKHLKIDDRPFYTVSATLEFLVLLVDYLKVVVNLNILTTETMSRVIEFMKAFNSRTCQVVLGAGAMRSAGLRNITAKHLALASQSLSMVSELISYIREIFRRHLSQTQAVMLVEFDRLKRDYQEHQNEIHAKLIAIMGDRLTIHITALQAVDWKVSSPGAPVNTYMVKLVEETTMLHKVLSRYLPLQIVELVMSEVLAAINHRLSEEFGKIELPDQQAKDRLLEDAKFLKTQFSTLKNVRAPVGMLETVVAEQPLPRPPGSPVPQTPSLARSSTMSANQRLRGLLSRSSTLPPSNSTQTPPIPPPSEKQPPVLSPSSGSGGSGFSASNGPITLGTLGSISASTLSLAASSPSLEGAAQSQGLNGSSHALNSSAPNGNSATDTFPSPPVPRKSDGANGS